MVDVREQVEMGRLDRTLRSLFLFLFLLMLHINRNDNPITWSRLRELILRIEPMRTG